MKSSKQIVVDFIVSELKLGKERGEVLAKVVKKWQTTTRTFDRYFKDAKQQHTQAANLIKDKVAKDSTIKALEAEKQQIMTVIERKKYLEGIVSGTIKVKQPFVMKDKIVEYMAEANHNERMKAIAELNKMEGDYAPTKSETNVTGVIKVGYGSKE